MKNANQIKIYENRNQDGSYTAYDEANPLNYCHDGDGWKAVLTVFGHILKEETTRKLIHCQSEIRPGEDGVEFVIKLTPGNAQQPESAKVVVKPKGFYQTVKENYRNHLN
jgi:hypothetical protein